MTLVTRATIAQEYCRQTGGFVAALTSAGDTTSLISTNMIGRGDAGDDNSLVGWSTYDGTDAVADALRIINTWDDSAGDATIDVMSGARAGTETIEYYPKFDPTGIDAREALNTVLRNTHRVVESVVPTYKGTREFSFLNAPWIETISDVLDSFQRNSPNLIDNGGFEAWGIGSNAGLHGWVLSGTNATVTRVDGTYGRYAARVTRSGTNVNLTQTIPIPIMQLYGEEISVFGRIKSSVAGNGAISISDGTDGTATSAHDGGGDWDEFTATHTVNADAAGPLTITLAVTFGDGAVDFETVVAVKGSSVPDWLSKYGNQHAGTHDLIGDMQVTSTGAMVRTRHLKDLGSQLVIVSRQPFFELSADSGAGGITDIPIDAAVSGMIVEMAQRQVSKPNAPKWESLYRVHAPKYARWKRDLAKKPARGTTTQVSVVPV